MASSDGLEKYAVALAGPASPVERAKVEEVDETVIVNDGSMPATPADGAAAPGEAANLAAEGGDGGEWEPADTKSPTLPPSRISRNAPAPAVPVEAQAILGTLQAPPPKASEQLGVASSQRRRVWLGVGFGALLVGGAVALAIARSGGPAVPVEPPEPPRASVAAPVIPPAVAEPSRQPVAPGGTSPAAGVAASAEPAPTSIPSLEPTPVRKPPRLRAKPAAKGPTEAPAAPPPPPAGDDNPY